MDLREQVARAMVRVDFGEVDFDHWLSRPDFAENYFRLADAALEVPEIATALRLAKAADDFTETHA